MQTLEERDVPDLHRRAEAPASAAASHAHGQANERGADRAVAAMGRMGTEATAPPLTGFLLPDAHDAHDLVGHPRDVRDRDERRGAIVDRVAVVVLEDPLLVAEDAAPEASVRAELPLLGGRLEGDVVRAERPDRFEDHGAPSCALRVEQAPQRPHPARMRLAREASLPHQGADLARAGPA